MSIACQCPSCSKRFNAPDQYAGKAAKCPQCSQPFVVGATSPITANRSAGPSFQYNEAPTRPAGGGSSSKRGLMIAAVAVGLLLAVGLVGGVGYWLFSGGGSANWKEYAPSGAGFTVLMPAAPTQKDKSDPKIAATTPIHEAVAQPSGSKITYSVQYYDLAGKPINNYLYLSWMKHYLLSGGGQLSREKDVTLSPYGGREVVVRLPDNQVMVRRVYLAEARVFWVSVQYPDTPVPPAEADKFLDSFKITSVAKAPDEPAVVAEAPEPAKKKKDRPDTKKKDNPTPPPEEANNEDLPPMPPKNPDMPLPAAGAKPTKEEEAVVQAVNRIRGEKKVQLLTVAPKLMDAARDSARPQAENKNAMLNADLGFPRVEFRQVSLPGASPADAARIIEDQAKRRPAFGNLLANAKSQAIGVGFAKTQNGILVCWLFFGGQN